MGRSDRWLMGMVAGAVLLVVAGFPLLLVVQSRPPEMLPEDTPAGVLQRYLLAQQEGRYDDADGYLSETVKARQKQLEKDGRPIRPQRPPVNNRPSTRIVLEDVQTHSETTQVTVAITSFSAPSPTDAHEYTTTQTFDLRREQGAWKITAPDYPCFFPY